MQRARHMWNVFHTLTVLPALVFALFSGVALGQQVPEEPVIRVGYFRDFRTLDPANLPGSPEYQIAINVYSGLVRYQIGSTDVEPDVAERWEVSDGGRVYTFFLRQDVVWHHGYGQLTAADVKYTLERILDPATNSRYRAGLEIIESIDVVDDFTIVLTLREPSAAFLATQLAFRPGMLVNQRAIEELGDDYAMNPIGTGPYQFVSYTPRQELILEANPNFFRGAPFIQRVEWLIIADENVAGLALQRGEINYMIPRSLEVWQSLKNAPGIAFTETPTAGYWQYALNTRRSPFDDVRVRRAVAHAIDKELFVDALLEGQGTPTSTVIPPGMIGHTEDVTQYPYDPELAKSLLAEAGYPDGFTANVVYNSGDEYAVIMATALQQWMTDIGIRLEMHGVEAGAWSARRQAGDYDITISGTTRADPDQILSEQFHSTSFPPGGNQSYYGAVDDLIAAQRVASTNEERAGIIAEIQRRIAEDVPEIPLFVPIYVTAYRDYIEGQVPNNTHWMTLFEHLRFRTSP